ncbi:MULTISPECIES: alpha-galactosidase [Nocardioides]|uniref:alpha-galactosidase n=1 Tax=Nocardioides vastitatis TaxID=2568655 RepID=A0ABW0ZBZ3_9ACTN|nr:alpha-galactosidase [Nocardioides sp.]THI99561.1 alpha-galactosidase [Nocardioides sp.]
MTECSSMFFPDSSVPGPVTRVEYSRDDDGFPLLHWTGTLDAPPSTDASSARGGAGPGIPLLGEHARDLFTRPHLRGHRVQASGSEIATGQSWSTKLEVEQLDADGPRLVVRTRDAAAGLAVEMELESVAGGCLRGRCTVTNLADGVYVVDGLEVVLPVPDDHVEALDFTGRHEHERAPQRHVVTDGLWLRESRNGRPGLGAATLLVVGTPGFGTTEGHVVGAHVAWSGNSVLRLERDPARGTTIGGGELLLPGEIGLARGESYRTPWVFIGAADDGLDGLAARLHDYQRGLEAHPATQPVVLNVWEAVFFDHDHERLKAIADRAAAVGIERFVLDDGWFHGRRDDTAGLGDWWVDEKVWPEGLSVLADHVRGHGMQFGLWFEPEMVNPDSDLYRRHPEWILSAGGRVPLLERNQLVLDLTRPEVQEHLFQRVDAILSTYRVDYVKWDHNRELLEAGSDLRSGAPAAHAQTLAFYALLDRLRAAHPGVAWESCASGGGRVDLGVLERVQRIWGSDMTDALARQHIQRWTTQLVAPEYVGAHVSAPRSPTTGRTLSLDFRAATALFGAFGVEWDLSTATEEELARLADWTERHKRFRPLLHSGRTVRPPSSDPAVLLHGVVARGGDEALLAHVQLDESSHNRGVVVRVAGLRPDAAYRLTWEGPVDRHHVSRAGTLSADGPSDGRSMLGAELSTRGYWVPRRRPETVSLVHITRAD